MGQMMTAPDTPGNIPVTLQVYNTLKKKIMDLQLRPGELLMVQTLSNELGASRTPVREAIVRLEREGLVESAPGKKFRVAPLTMKGLMEIYEIRKLVELHAVKHVARHATPAQVADLNATLVRMEAALKEADYDTFFENDLAFHEKLIIFHGNETLCQMMSQINDRIQRIRILTSRLRTAPEERIREHRDVIAAIEARNPDLAVEKMEVHLRQIKERLLPLLETQGFIFSD
ncbi:MAG: GntR family transcriptional regulator [Desulfobacterales bacterium]|nr:GntR family transcriptional regulator [Desulfobacterales bacterium]